LPARESTETKFQVKWDEPDFRNLRQFDGLGKKKVWKGFEWNAISAVTSRDRSISRIANIIGKKEF
jgi:hypothetical protein